MTQVPGFYFQIPSNFCCTSAATVVPYDGDERVVTLDRDGTFICQEAEKTKTFSDDYFRRVNAQFEYFLHAKYGFLVCRTIYRQFEITRLPLRLSVAEFLSITNAAKTLKEWCQGDEIVLYEREFYQKFYSNLNLISKLAGFSLGRMKKLGSSQIGAIERVASDLVRLTAFRKEMKRTRFMMCYLSLQKPSLETAKVKKFVFNGMRLKTSIQSRELDGDTISVFNAEFIRMSVAGDIGENLVAKGFIRRSMAYHFRARKLNVALPLTLTFRNTVSIQHHVTGRLFHSQIVSIVDEYLGHAFSYKDTKHLATKSSWKDLATGSLHRFWKAFNIVDSK